MAVYESTDNCAQTLDAPASYADGALAEVFADWNKFNQSAGQSNSYIRGGRSSTTVLDEFGDLQLFDSAADGCQSSASDYLTTFTKSNPDRSQGSADVSLAPIEFAGSAPITAGKSTGAIPEVVATGTHPQSLDAQKLFDANFGRLDKDHNGYISEQEIDRAMVNRNFTGEDAALVAMLKEKQHELEQLSNDEWYTEDDGITRSDMAEFTKLQEKDGKTAAEKALVDSVQGYLSYGEERLAGANRDLFGDKDNPLKSIKPEAVLQGRIDDCPFLADLAALADTAHGKQAIKDMIHTNDDGTYTVTFPGAPDQPITVAAPTDAELARYASGSDCGTWAAVLEKAYGKYCDSTNIVPQDGVPSGSPMPGFELLTGKTADRDLIDDTPRQVTEQKLKEAMEDGRPVTVVSRRAEQLAGDSGIEGSHAYSVLGYDPETNTIQLRNPWGEGEPLDENGQPRDGQDDGVFTMTLAEFEKNFGRVIYVEQ